MMKRIANCTTFKQLDERERLVPKVKQTSIDEDLENPDAASSPLISSNLFL